MASPAEFPIITRSRITEVGEDETKATPEEKRWFDIMKNEAPENATLKRRVGVCAIADVNSMNKDCIEVTFEGTRFAIHKPANSIRCARAREDSATAALEELNNQRQIKIAGAPINKDFTGIDVAAIRGLTQVADRFFFTPFY
jgi:hypothetical protein